MEYQLSGPIPAYPDEYRGDPFFGDPTPELDQRWIDHLRRKLFPATNEKVLIAPKAATIRLSSEEFSHYNQSGILLGDGMGYLATPTVYHDLHCIRFFHKGLYPAIYFSDDSKQKRLDRTAHARKCTSANGCVSIM